MTIKDRIFALLKERNIKAFQMEKDLGLAKGYLSKLDKSSPNSDKLLNIAKYLNVSIDYIMGYEPEGQKSDAQAVIDRITTNLKSSTTPALDVFEKNYRKDSVFMDWIEKLWSLPPEDKSTVYKVIAALYYSEKKDSRSSKEA